MGFGRSALRSSTGRTEKYTIPEASTAPVENADASFQFIPNAALRANPKSTLNRLNANGIIYVSEAEPVK